MTHSATHHTFRLFLVICHCDRALMSVAQSSVAMTSVVPPMQDPEEATLEIKRWPDSRYAYAGATGPAGTMHGAGTLLMYPYLYRGMFATNQFDGIGALWLRHDLSPDGTYDFAASRAGASAPLQQVLSPSADLASLGYSLVHSGVWSRGRCVA